MTRDPGDSTPPPCRSTRILKDLHWHSQPIPDWRRLQRSGLDWRGFKRPPRVPSWPLWLKFFPSFHSPTVLAYVANSSPTKSVNSRLIVCHKYLNSPSTGLQKSLLRRDKCQPRSPLELHEAETPLAMDLNGSFGPDVLRAAPAANENSPVRRTELGAPGPPTRVSHGGVKIRAQPKAERAFHFSSIRPPSTQVSGHGLLALP